MPIRKIQELSEYLPKEGRLLGLDLGTKTIGLAISDVLRSIASPYSTIIRKKFSQDASALERIIDNEQISALILGLPINMDGTIGPRAQSTKQFGNNLAEKMKIQVAFWDERLSTVAVSKTMIEADLSRAKRAKIVDKMAATYILQGALDFLRNENGGQYAPFLGSNAIDRA